LIKEKRKGNCKEGFGQEDDRQEGPGQEDGGEEVAGEEGRSEEVAGQEGRSEEEGACQEGCQESTCEKGCRQEGRSQEGREKGTGEKGCCQEVACEEGRRQEGAGHACPGCGTCRTGEDLTQPASCVAVPDGQQALRNAIFESSKPGCGRVFLWEASPCDASSLRLLRPL
jgi:hypothetical protein